MRKIEFVTTGSTTTVKVDGIKVQGIALDSAQIKVGRNTRVLTKAMEDGILKRISTRAADEGLTAEELKIVMNRFTKEMADA